MTRLLNNLSEISEDFDVAVLDQWGVLHDGTQPYPDAVNAIKTLQQWNKQIVVVSNSGKRADLNRQRMGRIGLPVEAIAKVVTSGEALWEDVRDHRLKVNGRKLSRFFPISGQQGDPANWAGELSCIEMMAEFDDLTDAILLMGLPDGTRFDAHDDVLKFALQRKTPMVCSNPDKTSPRSGGLVISPGALADRYSRMGGTVLWYGKPHASIYRSVIRSFPTVDTGRFLMVGDSLEHDIAGAQNIGFRSAFIRGGIHASDFSSDCSDPEIREVIGKLAGEYDLDAPDYCLAALA